MRHCFLPPDIHSRIPGAPVDREQELRRARPALARIGALTAPGVYTANNTENTPGTLLNLPYSDPRAIEATAGVEATLSLLHRLGVTFGSGGLAAVVNYGRDYDNAFWDGEQMVFGNGDRKYFNPFTVCLDIPGHELFHGVTGDRLDYSGQPGALNEHISDCGGAVVRQQALGIRDLSVNDAWLIGKGLFTPRVAGTALRNMLNPGTAYNDGVLGRDDQPAKMSDYFETRDDDGGVHTNSGIPNRAFALASRDLGDSVLTLSTWLRALDGLNNPRATFKQFAEATVRAADSPLEASVIQNAWVDVEVLTESAPGGTPSTDGPFPGATPEVARRILHAAGGENNVPRWMNHHFDSYFRIKE